jgi:putative serine protease PepD
MPYDEIEGPQPDVADEAVTEPMSGEPDATAPVAETPPADPTRTKRGIWPAAIAGGAAGLLAGLLVVGVALAVWSPRGTTVPVPIAATTTQSGSAAAAAPTNVRGIVAKAEPAVVSITDTIGRGFFAGMAAGTGMILTPDGEVLTNAHVVDEGSNVRVTVPGRGSFGARILGIDTGHDIALLKMSGVSGLPTVTFASAVPEVGDAVVAMGNALALNGSPTVTTGIVSALGRQIPTDSGTLTNLIQTDAAINQGNSGGPLLNSSGQVIGMNTAIAGDAQNIGFAIPVGEIQPRLAALSRGQNGSSEAPGYLGVSVADANQGASITAVVSSSPADRAGLRAGDEITAIDGQTINGANDLVSAVQSRHPGDKVTLTIVRSGSTIRKTATLGSAPQGFFAQ